MTKKGAGKGKPQKPAKSGKYIKRDPLKGGRVLDTIPPPKRLPKKEK